MTRASRAGDLAYRRGRRRTGRARLVCTGQRRAGRSGARSAERGGRSVATGGRDGARCGSGAAVAPGAGARSRAGGAGVRGVGRARRDPGPRVVAELRADVEGLQGQLLISQGRIEQAARVLESGAARIQDRDRARAALMLCGAAFAKSSLGEMPAAVATAEAAVELAGHWADRRRRRPNRHSGGLDRCGGGRPRLSAAAAARRARRSMRASAGRLVWTRASRPVRVLDGGLRHGASRARARGCLLARRGLVSNLPLALSALAELEFRVGNWTARGPSPRRRSGSPTTPTSSCISGTRCCWCSTP